MRLFKNFKSIFTTSVLTFALAANALGNPLKIERKDWFMMGSVGFSYGIQSISIPPLQNKFSMGVNLKLNKKWNAYFLPGFTGGIAPSGAGHIETGLQYRFITLDYSYNVNGASHLSENLKDQSINAGLIIKLNPKKANNLSLWFKYGRSFWERGFDQEPPTWNGNNLEVKLVYTEPFFDNNEY